MNLHEPTTLATDYLLFLASLVFAIRLWRVFRPWSLAFFFTALGSLFGGTYHGFLHMLTPFAAEAIWKATVFAIGLASFFLLLGTARALTTFAVVKLIVYTSWMITHDDFLWVMLDYGATMLIIGAVQIAAWIRERAPSAPWVIGSIAVAIAGALVQASGLTLHRHFNHNDLYHVIQLVALWLLYRGGLRMSSTSRPTTRPT